MLSRGTSPDHILRRMNPNNSFTPYSNAPFLFLGMIDELQGKKQIKAKTETVTMNSFAYGEGIREKS